MRHKIYNLHNSLTFQQLTRGIQITFKSEIWKYSIFKMNLAFLHY